MFEVPTRARIDIGCEGAIDGGRSAIIPILMKIPIDRYLNSEPITFTGLECIMEAPFDVDNPYMLSVFSHASKEIFVMILCVPNQKWTPLLRCSFAVCCRE